MTTIKYELPKDAEIAHLHTFADLHIGDKLCDMESIRERINAVRDDPLAYAILNGDIMNNATKTSVSDCYAEDIPPMEQLEQFVHLFEPIKDKIVCVTQGNHENRTYIKEGIDLTAVAAKQLGILQRYAKTGACVYLKIGDSGAKNHHHPVTYCIYVTHGSGGGRKEGAKAIRLADMASIIDADIYIHSHTHLPMIMKQGYFRTDLNGCSTHHVERLFVNTSSMLGYGGYGEAYEFKPNSTKCPVITISGKKKSFYAEL